MLVLSFSPLDPGDEIEVISLGSNYVYLTSLLPGPIPTLMNEVTGALLLVRGCDIYNAVVSLTQPVHLCHVSHF